MPKKIINRHCIQKSALFFVQYHEKNVKNAEHIPLDKRGGACYNILCMPRETGAANSWKKGRIRQEMANQTESMTEGALEGGVGDDALDGRRGLADGAAVGRDEPAAGAGAAD